MKFSPINVLLPTVLLFISIENAMRVYRGNERKYFLCCETVYIFKHYTVSCLKVTVGLTQNQGLQI